MELIVFYTINILILRILEISIDYILLNVFYTINIFRT
jgi:hypothetical protein